MSAIVSMAEAARLAGRGRATLYRDVEKGKLSKVSLPDGKPGVQVSELMRVYGQLKKSETPADSASGQSDTQRDISILEERIRSLEASVRHKDEMNEQLKARLADKDFIIGELQTKVLMIEHVKLSPETERETPREKTSFLGRLFSRR